jgi:hypothetical protein
MLLTTLTLTMLNPMTMAAQMSAMAETIALSA